jgi:SAM-dependent methyltransferase
VVIRPVRIKGEHHIQVSRFDERRDVTKNHAGDQALRALDELLALPFKSFHVQTTEETLQVQFSRKGKLSFHRRPVSEPLDIPSLDHDRRKKLPLPVGEPDPYLQGIGIMTREGQVRARMRRKYRQINEFLKLTLDAGIAELPGSGGGGPSRPLRIVDCGCGNAYLSFAVYHYLSHVLRVPTRLVGIDVNASLLQRRSEQVRALGWTSLTFQTAQIAEYVPDEPPDVVLALHACDTATDEALAQACKWQSTMIFAAPCCHHHLQAQLSPGPAVLWPVYRHGILKERLGDVMTDALRALLLCMAGYDADVIQFVSTEHTDKNLMIRARRTGDTGSQAAREYGELVAFLGVSPYLEYLLKQDQVLKE